MAVARVAYQLEFRSYRRKFRRPLATARGVWAFREGIIVRLTDADGRVGYGEAAPVRGFTKETVAGDLAWLNCAESQVTADSIRRLPPRFACVRWALECARAMLEDKLPAPTHASLAVAALLPAGTRALAVLPGFIHRGFRVFKWKVAVVDVAVEFSLLEKLLAKLPRNGKLRLDANGGLRAREWKIWRCKLESLGAAAAAIEFFEQPVAQPRPPGGPVPVALDESVIGLGGLRRARAARWPGPLVVKPSLLGDGENFVRWRNRARADLVYSSAFETSVGLHAALSLAAGDPRAGERALGFGTLDAFDEDGLQLPEHRLAPTMNSRRLAPEKFSEIWERLTHRT